MAVSNISLTNESSLTLHTHFSRLNSHRRRATTPHSVVPVIRSAHALCPTQPLLNRPRLLLLFHSSHHNLLDMSSYRFYEHFHTLSEFDRLFDEAFNSRIGGQAQGQNKNGHQLQRRRGEAGAKVSILRYSLQLYLEG